MKENVKENVRPSLSKDSEHSSQQGAAGYAIAEAAPDLAINPSQSPPRSPAQSKRRLSPWLGGLLVLGLLTGGGWLAYRQLVVAPQAALRRQLQTVPVERTTLKVTVSANGTIQPERSINVSPKNSGRLKSLLVEEGDRVSEGQILAYMDDSNLQGELVQVQGQIDAAQARLGRSQAGNRPQEISQAAASLRSAEASLRQAEDDLRRYQQLYNEGAISAQSLATYRTTRDSAQAAVDQTRQALNLAQAGNRPEDIAEARAQVRQYEGAMQVIQSQIDDMVIRAPFSGIVTNKFANPGDFVTPTTSGSTVSSATSSSILSLASNYQVMASVAEKDIAQIRIGQAVTIAADAYGDRTFTGKVAQIAAQATVEQNVTSFEVRVDILSDSEQLLRPGMNVNADFQVGQRENVLVVPTVAIARQDSGSGVMVLDATGRPRFTPIETGITVGSQTEVRSGLSGDEQIVMNAPTPSGDSSESRPRSIFPPRP
ncbi:MAG: efflux RND transporter periplasmic adaptor subunit [Elainellaceae cyanobacterium]